MSRAALSAQRLAVILALPDETSWKSPKGVTFNVREAKFPLRFAVFLCLHKEIKKLEFNQFCKLLFAKTAKVDPLPGIPGLAMAKKVNGKWVAVPIEETSQIAQGK